jgi:hypothetical protein
MCATSSLGVGVTRNAKATTSSRSELGSMRAFTMIPERI